MTDQQSQPKQTAAISIRFPATARDAAVVLLNQIVQAINAGEVVSGIGDPKELEKWRDKAALVLSDALIEQK